MLYSVRRLFNWKLFNCTRIYLILKFGYLNVEEATVCQACFSSSICTSDIQQLTWAIEDMHDKSSTRMSFFLHSTSTRCMSLKSGRKSALGKLLGYFFNRDDSNWILVNKYLILNRSIREAMVCPNKHFKQRNCCDRQHSNIGGSKIPTLEDLRSKIPTLEDLRSEIPTLED